jgi:hypothetical protein
LTWLEAAAPARAVGESLMLTATLSATHLIGFTLVMGSAVLSNMRLLGAMLPGRPLAEVLRPAARTMTAGLVISIATGFLMFMPRAVAAAASGAFRLKMLLLVLAVIYQISLHARLARDPVPGTAALRLCGALGMTLWLGLTAAACWFILFE